MSNETENKIVPKLRFPEFRDDGDWAESVLGDIGKFTGGGTPSRDNESFWKGNIPWISSSDIDEDSIYQLKISRFITEEALENSTAKRVPSKSILLVSRVGVGKLAVSQEVICTSQDFTNFTPTDDNAFFLAYYMKSQKETLHGFSQGMAIKGFTKEEVSNLKILKPSKDEQRKIASCLSSLDELITAETEKLAQLKAHKKGLMQNLFPSEGETVPKLRFPEFDGGEEWEEKKLGSVATFLKGKGISKADIVENGSLECIRYGELYTYYGEIIDSVKSCTTLLPDDLVLSQANDVIIPASGETKEDIARASCVLRSGIALGGDLNIIRSNINGVFLSYLLNNVKKQEIAKLAQGYSVVHLYSYQLEKLVINIPKIAEQQKIAECLSSIDKLITEIIQRIETIKLHKNGLMKQLFPQVNETRKT